MGIPIRFNESAFRHGITPDEIRAVIEFPRYRSRAVSRRDPWREVYLIIGQIDREALIEVAAELTPEPAWEVFHAMLLRQTTADQVRDTIGTAADFTAGRTQRRQERRQ
ncbi:hypothetical protein GCM10023197_35630 [Gordonia humi]|uniref:Uncharacterized protein n=1 Tax=Gordonia humi TaxID=686429 RepID=A0A840F6P7_9ACTN|nr:hypothetical protein [Gordonia humi]MBB4137229.1 hypothetical protein [Gordonia humi]